MGETGTVYVSQRLLSKQATISPMLDHTRRIASRLARQDSDNNTVNSGSYTAYINKLSELLMQEHNFYVKALFADKPTSSTASTVSIASKTPLGYVFTAPAPYTEHGLLIAAAAYTGHLSIVQELSEHDVRTMTRTAMQTYTAAARGGKTDIIDYLLCISDPRQEEYCKSMLQTASEKGALNTVQHLLASEWMPDVWNDSENQNWFNKVMASPNVDILKALRQYQEASAPPETSMSEHHFAHALSVAAARGYTDLVAYLLGINVSIDESIRATGCCPLWLACCQDGHEPVIRLLLEHGASSWDPTMAAAAAAGIGRFDVVKLLVAYGAEVNGSNPALLVSAVQREHTSMFYWLMEHGAELTGAVYEEAMKLAIEDGLESMIELLEVFRPDA